MYVLFNIRQNTYKGFQKNNVAAAFLATSQGRVANKGWSFVWMRSSRVWMRSSRVWMRSSRGWMRSSRAVRASGCQCQSRNSPEFDPRILRYSGIWGAADEAVLNKKKNPKIPVLEVLEVRALSERKKRQHSGSGHLFYHFWGGGGGGWRVSSKETIYFFKFKFTAS